MKIEIWCSIASRFIDVPENMLAVVDCFVSADGWK